MNCLHPIFASVVGKRKDGKKILSFKGSSSPDLCLPCGKCEACLENKRSCWRDRMRLQLFASGGVGTFLTLTYNDEYCPDTLRRSDLQNFFKRFRNIPRDFGVPLSPFSYFAVGEYGTLHHRPHYHVALFGLDLTSPEFLVSPVSFNGSEPLFSSGIVSRVWPYGFNSVGRLDSSSINYVSKYLFKDLHNKYRTFYLRSLGLGSRPFYDSTRVGKKWFYNFHSSFKRAFEDGFFYLPDSRFVSSPVSFPSVYKNRIRDLYPDLFDFVSQSRLDYISNLSEEARKPANARFLYSKKLAENQKRKIK